MSFIPDDNPITHPTRESYTVLRPFRFWCQKVLPLVYDDSLSYYELLCKVVDYLNKTMEDVDHMNTDMDTLYENFQQFQEDTFALYNQLVEYVNNYFNNLDVQTEINNKLDEMVVNGSFTTLLAPLIPDIVTDWLTEHITPTSPVIDDTLTITGAGADAKKTGDVTRDLNYYLGETIKQSGIVFEKNMTTGYSINATVGRNITFVENENRMYYSFKTNNSFKVDTRKNTSSFKCAIIVCDDNGLCLSNTGWIYRNLQNIDINDNSVVYILCDFVDETKVPNAYVESAIKEYIVNELSSSSPIWENGGINRVNGNENNDDSSSIRTVDKLFFYGLAVFIKDSSYRVKIYVFDENGTYLNDMNWITTNKTVIAEEGKLYSIQISTTDETDIVMRTALQNVRIVPLATNPFEDELSRTKVELNQKIVEKGYKCVIPLDWESGSITSTGGNKNPDENVIRTPFPALTLEGKVKVFIEDSDYRVRFYYYDSTGETFVSYSSWYTTPGEFEYSINPNYTYRIQIATQNASSMNLNDAMNKILFCYSGDTIVDSIPPYWYDYLYNKTNVINSYLVNGNNKSVFLFLTDTHYNENPTYLNSHGINDAMMKYISSECNINTVIHGGDLNSEYRTDKNMARKLMIRPVSLMRKAFENVLVTRGNHDDNIEGNNNVWSYVISQSDAYSYMFRGINDVVFGETGTYFYKDIPHEKLRIVSIDCVDFPYSNSVDSSKSDLKILAYGYTQLQWLCDVLKNTPSGYHIVIYTHAMLAPSIVTIDNPSTSPQTRALNYLTVCEILKAFKNRDNFTYTMNGSFVSTHQDYYTGNIVSDFTNCDSTIVAVFSGHEHVDCIEEILDSNGNEIGIKNTCTQNSSNMFASSIISSTYQHPMEIGTTSELVWDAVVIDRKNKHVDMIRIGANGANTDVESFDVRSFNYN